MATKKLKQFKKKPEPLFCEGCEKEQKALSSIRISTTNVNHLYKGSGRSWRNNYRAKLCKKCFDHFEKELRNIFFN